MKRFHILFTVFLLSAFIFVGGYSSVFASQRFKDHGDVTVTDTKTGLMWTKNANLPGERMNWNDAINYCRNLNHAGYSDWLLPSRGELASLVDYSQRDPALPKGHPFQGVVSTRRYWASRTHANNTERAWAVVIIGNRTNRCYIWPVRAGQ